MRSKLFFVVSLVVALAASTSLAAEKEYKWDGFELTDSGMELAAMGGFVEGEAFAVRFQPDPGDYPVTLKRVDLLFAGQMGEAATTKQVGYKIFADLGTSAQPGAELASGTASLTSIDLASGSGQIEQLPSVDIQADNVVVNSGGIRVAFYQGWTGTPSITADGSTMSPTIVSNVNYILAADPFGQGFDWYKAESLGVSGNWVMRLVVETAGGPVEDVIEQDTTVDSLEVTSISPDSGLDSEATAVIILGEGFEAGLSLFIGSTQVDAEFITSITSTKITATVPSGLAVGFHDVVVENPGGNTAILGDGFEVISGQGELALDSVVPGEGYTDEETPIKLLGAGFFEGVAVFVGATELPTGNVTVTSDTLIDAVVPAGLEPGVYTLLIQGDQGEVASAANAFTVKERDVDVIDPEVLAVSPNWGGEDTEFEISVVGENFQDGARVKLSGVKLATVFIDAETLQATVPEGKDAGNFSVGVENPDGGSGTLVDGLKLYPLCVAGAQAFEKCVCGETKLNAGQYCCDGLASAEACLAEVETPTCTGNGMASMGCLCGGTPIASGMYCCDAEPSNTECKRETFDTGCRIASQSNPVVWIWMAFFLFLLAGLAVFMRKKSA